VPLPKAGDKAPAFSAQDDTGKTVTLADFAGHWVVLYFYPKDDTPG
jgi:peroxiredoxin Q/BCP